MPLPYDQAVDEIYGMIVAAWPASSAIAGYVPEIFWSGAPKGYQVPMDKFWARVTHKIVSSNQASLANNDGVKKYTTIGLLFFQLFCPRQVASSKLNGEKLAQVIRNCFCHESPSGSVWFRDQRIDPLDETTENYPFNVVITFQFDTVQ